MRYLLCFLVLISFTQAYCSMTTVTPTSIVQNLVNTSEENVVRNVYFLSGLGADERAFARLTIDKKFNIHFVKWIDPIKNESLHHYAERLLAQIDTAQPFQLVGLSFGGIMASVISDLVKPQQIILLSSRATSEPLSKFYRNLIKITLWHPFAASVLKSANKFTYRFFGAHTNEERQLLKQILKDTDSDFLKWAIKQISAWDRKEKAVNVYHIHGTEDNLITPNLVNPDVWIEGGGHLMVYSHAEKVSELLNKQLSQSGPATK